LALFDYNGREVSNMTHRFAVALFLIAFTLPPATLADTGERTSTIHDRESLNLTVYNGGTALIHDRRRVTLTGGVNRIAWRDVSAGIDPTSALLEPVGSAKPITVLEQNFDFDLLDPSALLQKYVGKDVIVVHDARFAGERDKRETARILSTNNGIVLQYRDRIETDVRGHIIFPTSSRTLRDRPTLVLDVESDQTGSETLDLSYLTGGLTWRADYVGVLSPDEKRMSLNGLITLTNTSGESYDGAHLQLVAGNVNVTQPANVYALKTIARVTSRASGSLVSQENYFEYHLYTLARPTTILDKQTKQVSLLSATVPVKKTLELRGSDSYYRSAEPDLGDRMPVSVYVSFDNRGGELGVPLPAGIVRLYKNDSRGTTQFVGSDNIDHTPKNEHVRLHLGDSFDVTARKKQTDFQFDPGSGCATESSYEIALSNAKDVSQDVLVVEPIPAQWNISKENVQHTKSSASTATWNVHVPANGSFTLTYTAHVNWCWP
jgi:hypothetical protein